MEKKSSSVSQENLTGIDLANRIHDGILNTEGDHPIRVEIPLPRQEGAHPDTDIQAVVFNPEHVFGVTDLGTISGRLLIVGLLERPDGSQFTGMLRFDASGSPLIGNIIVNELTPPPIA
jgi:hypothetical protein